MARATEFGSSELPEASAFVSSMFNPKIVEFAKSIGIDEALIVPKGTLSEATGINLGQAWLKYATRLWTMEWGLTGDKAKRYVLDRLEGLLSRTIKKQELLDYVIKALLEGKETVVVEADAPKAVVVHEICHKLAADLGVPFDEVAPDSIVHGLFEETGDPVHLYIKNRWRESRGDVPWVKRTQEAYTEVLARYFIGQLKEGGTLHRLAEAMIRNSDKPFIRDLIGTALGVYVAVTGLWKELPHGRTSQ
jgi:hypothetical protein